MSVKRGGGSGNPSSSGLSRARNAGMFFAGRSEGAPLHRAYILNIKKNLPDSGTPGPQQRTAGNCCRLPANWRRSTAGRHRRSANRHRFAALLPPNT